MRSLMTYLPFDVPGAAAHPYEVGALADAYPFVSSDIDYGATEQWLFGTDGGPSGTPSLTGRIAGRLVAPADLGLSPYNTSYLTTQDSSTRMSGLVTDIAEADEETMVIVTRYHDVPADTMIAGTLSSSSGAGGWGLFASGGVYRINTRGTAAPADLTIPAGLSDGDWMVVIVAHSIAAGVRRVLVGGASTVDEAVCAKVKSTRTLAIGHAYYGPATFPTGIQCAGATIYPRCLGAGEMLAAVTRAVATYAARSITLAA